MVEASELSCASLMDEWYGGTEQTTSVRTWEAKSSEIAKMTIQTDKPTWPEPPHIRYTACKLLPAVTEYVIPAHAQATNHVRSTGM